MSDEHKDGGPAFPQPVATNDAGDVIIADRYDGCAGMTLRDWFAGQALAGWLAQAEVGGTPSEFATWCYEQADAMLVERARKR